MKYNIIVCDDHPVVQLSLKSIIENNFSDYSFTACNSINKLLVDLREKKTDLAILDINITNQNILDSYSEITAINPEIKIIIFSNYTDLIVPKLQSFSNVRGIISKTADENEIVNAINVVLEGNFYSDSMISKQESGDIFRKLEQLTSREKEIIEGITLGKTNQIISETLFISIETVKTHRKNIYRKLEINTVNELISIAINNSVKKEL